MKLSQALKEKNRLANELERKKEIFQRENSRRNDNVSKIDRRKLFEEISALRVNLVELKAKIARANNGMVELLAQLQEAKSYLVFLQSVRAKEGEEIIQGYGASEPLKFQWDCLINQEKLDELIEQEQKNIDSIQDAIDEYNVTTNI